ncbi:N-acetylneuraminic acid mutarotase, partial [Flagellimonas zhangzhouensis]
MKENYSRGIFLLQLLIFIISVETFSQNFTQSQINFNGLGNVSEGVTSLMYGPDGRLYVAEYPGTIKILTIERNGPTDYVVTNIETLSGVKNIVNHDDDGSPCTGTSGDCSSRETTGLTVAGTASNPIIYVTSSDFRIGAGSGGGNGDIDLDTNSGVITRFTWTGTEWDVVDLVRGLPRSEENHATNGLEVATINGTEYLIVASGGITNGGAPSTNFVFTCEYALSGAILSVDLDAINLLPTQTDVDGREFIYDLPTLDDPTRANANGITDPNDPNYDGIDLNDPWGGNDGLNQAMVVTGGPVQIYSPGYRNAYDIVLTESGALYATDNGANGGWGGFPVNEGVDGTVTNAYDPAEPGSQSSSGGEIIDNKDHLQLITTDVQSYVPGSLYGGHPNPTRANPSGAGLFTDNGSTQVFRTLVYDPDGSTLGSTSDPSIALPANWPPVKTANPVEGDWRSPSSTNPDGPDDDPVVIWGTNTNGIDEYTASNFSGAMQGNLLAGNNGGYIRRVQLQTDGSLQNLTSNFLSGIGGNALGITCNSDNDIFPGTIWAGTLNGLIVVFEPQDFIQCDNPEGEPLADFDGDGYTNQDELDNGTDPCNGGSQPDDFDKSAGAPLVSNLNDLDDDNDGIPDASDPFQLGDPETSGSDAFVLPIGNDLFNDQQGLGGIFGLGMTGLMNNGDTAANWLDWIDDRDNGPNPNDVLGGAPGIMTSHMTEGTALGASNNQDKGYQYGVQVDNTTGKFAVVGGMNGFTGPLRLYENTDGVSGGELGFFIGDGTQSNYIKFVVTTDGFTALQEIDDIPGTPMEAAIALGDRPTSGIRFYFVVDPVVGTVDLEYEIDSNPRTSLGQINASGTILQAIQTNSLDLAVGFIGSSNTPGKELEGSWDFLNVISEEPITDAGVVARVNASGSLVTDPIDGVDWQSNDTNGATSGPGYSVNTGTGYPSGLLYANRHPSIPASMNQSTFESLFELERYDPETGEEMEFLFPVANGNYVVNLYLGNSFSGTSQVGDRVFDIAIEGQVVGQNIDLVALFGHESGGMLSYQVDVQDSELNVQFIHEVQNPLVNAIEILSIVPDQNPIIVEPIANQHNMEGDILDGSLGVVASGGDGNLSFSAFNLPPGVFIEPTNGQIGGAIEPLAATGSPYSVSIVVDDGDEQSLDAVTINFDWTIISNNLSWTDKDEDESYTARHENSFVQSGIHFYVMGGRENATSIDVYDYTNDSWTELTGITPTVDGAQLEFNHFQATEYKGLIWVIGAFKSNAYPNEVPAEYIWMFDPASQEWIQGPQIPEGRRRGSAGLALYNDKFYVVGGNNDGHDGGYVAQFDEYDPATGTWTTLTDAPRARDHFSAVVIGDKLYVAGGRISGGTNGVFKPVIAEVDVYDFTSGTWSTLPSDQNIPTPRAGAAAVNFNDKLIVIGGEVQNELVYGVSTDDALSITEEYDPVTQTWDRLPDMNYERQGIQAIVSGPGVHVLGGSPNRGGGNQKNLEYLGEDAPVGTPIVGSALSAPTTVVFNDGETLEIDLDVIDGNTGLFISSMEVTG